ncbi:MAG: polysulfide reductase NrfD [Chloroflexi bacterium]|nr:polysulfide reductase NrfD [Chloroflexota bacterium]
MSHVATGNAPRPMSRRGALSLVSGKRRWLLFAVWTAVLAFGLWGLYERFTAGHRLAGYGNFVTWGLWVSAYIWFVGLSAGSFLLSSLIYVFRMKQLEPIGKLSLFTALVTLLAALAMITFDIGHMERIWEFYVRGNYRSMMAWMVWLYSAYSLLVTAELYLAMRHDLVRLAARNDLVGRFCRIVTFMRTDTSAGALERDRKVLAVLGLLGVPLAVTFHGGVGALFGVVMARPFWNSSIYPLLFLVGALLSGTAFFSLIVAFFWSRRQGIEYQQVLVLLARFTLGLLLLDLLFEWAEYSISMYYSVVMNPKTPGEAASFWLVITGPYWWVYWIVHLAIGAAVPVFLLLWRPRAAWAIGIAGALISASFLAVRINIVVPALAVPQFEGLERAFSDSRLALQYLPTPFEWAVLSLIGALAVAALYVGIRYLPLMPEKEATA